MSAEFMLNQLLSWARYILLLRWPYAGEAYLFSLVTTGCVNARGGKKGFEGKLLPAFVKTLIVTCGSGIVAPVLLRDPPLFFNDDRLCTCILIFFLLSIRFDPYVTDLIKHPFLWKPMTLLSTCSRMSKIAFMVDYAASKLPASPYYPIAIFGPILAGLLRGIGGSLVPCDKGLAPLRGGLSFKYQLSLFVAVFYHIVANDHYLVGGIVRGALGLEEFSREDVRLMVAAFGTTVTSVQLYLWSECNPFTPAHEVLYRVTGVPRAACAKLKSTNGSTTTETASAPISGSNGSSTDNGTNGNSTNGVEGTEKELERRALYDLKARQRTQIIFDAFKSIAVAAVAVLALYSNQPPTYISAGEFITLDKPGLAACTFMPAPLRIGCEPLRATVSEAGSLVVFKGDLKANVPLGKEGGDVLFSSPPPRFKRFEPEQLRLELTNDGLLVVMAGPTKLWSSTLTPLGKRLPPYRVEARLDPVRGALEVYKGGNLQWSSAGRV